MQYTHVKIACLLQESGDYIAYCERILSRLSGTKKSFDPGENIDQFYMTVHNACFAQALLIINSLLDMGKDRQTVSFKNWSDFKNIGTLQQVHDRFKSSSLSPIRNKRVAHQEDSHSNMLILNSRRKGMPHGSLVQSLRSFQNDLVSLFLASEATREKRYDAKLFDSAEATNEVESVLELAPPILTNDTII